MAKKAILDVLEHTIGRYVRNLDAKSLNVAVWSGKIELRDLELDVDGVNRELRRRERAAPNLAVLPVRVLGGRFESLTVDVPWARITSRPVVLRARGLTVSLRPRDDDDGRNDDHAGADPGGRSRRRAAVEDAEEERRMLNAVRRLAASDDPSGESKESGFSEKLVRRVVENLQFEVSDVRLELKGCGADAGVVLESLSLVTTDEEGNRTFVDRTESKKSSSFLFKALDIRGLGVFLDDLTRVDGAALTEETRSWILSPLSFSATLRQSDSVRCVDFPKYLVRSCLSNSALSLSRPQLEALFRLTTVVASGDRNRPLFPQYRPDLPLSRDTAELYWRYAVRCVGRLTRRSSWKEFFLAFRKRQIYIPLYKRHAHAAECKWMKPLDSRELARLRNVDDDPSVSAEGLMGWRNMADAQADRERAHYETAKQAKQAAQKKKSGGGGLFGNLFRDDKAETTSGDGRESAAPIKLSTEEMKELERLDLERASDADLSVDSILCDVLFSLQSLETRLDDSDGRPLARFVMGTVSASLVANNDGSYQGRFTLTDVRLEDLVTRDTLFPCVLRNVTEEDEDEDGGGGGGGGDGGEGRHALAFAIEGKSSGDQDVSLRMVALEVVAPPELLFEVKRFFELPSSHVADHENPYLYASAATGSVAAFYDATDAPLDAASTRRSLDAASSHGKTADRLAGALSDAWDQRRERRSCWTVDLRVRSPIVVLPRDPADPEGAVLVFDAGRLRASFGESSSSELVDRWFGDRLSPQRVREDVDRWTIESRDAQLSLGEAGTWRTRAPSYVVEPTSASLRGGTETAASASDQRPLTCVFGVSKSLVVTASPTRVRRIRELIDAWTKVGERLGLTPNKEEEEEHQGAEILPAEPPVSARRRRTASIAEEDDDDDDDPTSDPRAWLHVSFALRRLSARFDVRDDGSENREGLEANLVSVVCSSTSVSDGSSSSNLGMGWFWVSDRTASRGDAPRRRRLLAHSDLPGPAESYEPDGHDRVLEDLRTMGAFEASYAGSSDLADVTVSMKPDGDTVVDATFDRVLVNYNPEAVGAVLRLVNGVLTEGNAAADGDAGALVARSDGKRNLVVDDSPPPTGTTTVRAKLRRLELSLNSVLDDLPLFAMATEQVELKSVTYPEEEDDDESNLDLSVSIGDVAVRAPGSGRARPAYATLLGSSPSSSGRALLTVRYRAGSTAVGADSSLDFVADVVLSPLRVVYVQAQILALVEFVATGVLGSLAVGAADAARAATVEAHSGGFRCAVRGAGADVVIPRAADDEERFVVGVGALAIDYEALPDDGGGRASLVLEGVDLRSHDPDEPPLLARPVRATVDASLPGERDDAETAVRVDVSAASFALRRPRYAQLMGTLATNMGESDHFLRNEREETVVVEEATSAASSSLRGSVVTHAGLVDVAEERRTRLDVTIEETALELRDDEGEALLRITASRTEVGLVLDPASGDTVADVRTRRMEVEDARPISEGRQFRRLADFGTGDDEFRLVYRANDNGDTSVDVTLGAPKIVVLPDILSESLDYLILDDEPRPEVIDAKKDPQKDKVAFRRLSSIKVEVDDDDAGAVEAAYDAPRVAADVEGGDTKFTVKTSDCRFMMVDMGSVVKADNNVKELTEAVVFQGRFDVDAEFKADSSLKLNFQTVGMQSYTTEGNNLRCPVQILEPSDMVLVLTKTVAPDCSEEIELKFVALSEIDATVSMRNLALVHAISVSVEDSFHRNRKTEARTNLDESVRLSETEVKRLERMSLEMMNETQWENDTTLSAVSSSERSLDAASSASDQQRTVDQSCKVNVTLPETTVTIVNDLQGLDQALFLLRLNNVVFGGEYHAPIPAISDSATPATSVATTSTNSTNGPTWNFHLNVNILADYFDISTNLWERFLLRQWEVNTSSVRCEEKKSSTGRMMTVLDVESHPCHVSFSERFLVGLGAANRMWSVYSTAMANAVQPDGDDGGDDDQTALERKSMAANAARSLVTTMPYGITNRTGLANVEFSISNDDDAERAPCPPGSIRYFRFESPRGKGVGGKRLYGQHVTHHRALTIFVGTHVLRFDHIDGEVNRPRRAHYLGESRHIFTDFVNTGKATIVYLYSHVHVHNQTNIPFSIATQSQDGIKDVGVCHGRARSEGRQKKRMSSSDDRTNHVSSKYPCSLGIPTDLLPNLTAESSEASEFDLLLCPHMSDPNFNCLEDTPPRAAASLLGNGGSFGWGAISFPSVSRLIQIATKSNPMESMEVVCSMSNDAMNVRSVGFPVGAKTTASDPVCLQVCVKVTLVANSLPFVEVFLQPRTLLKNQLPLSLLIRTPMKHTFSPPNATGVCVHSVFDLHDHATHCLEPEQSVEVFTPGHSIAITCMCADGPTAGQVTGWAEGWIDVPLGQKRRLTEPLQGMFPFVGLSVNGGSTFCVVESTFTSLQKPGGKQDGNSSKSVRQKPADLVRSVLIIVDNFVVDHTKRNLFELKVKEKLVPLKKKQPAEANFVPWSAFALPRSGYRVTLLPKSSVPFCLIEQSIDLDSGMRKSLPFKVDDLSISNGGVESNSIFWEDKTPSGFFAYRKLGTLGQSEVHVIPEFVVFNGSDQNTIQIKQPGSINFDLKPGKIAPLSRDSARNLIMMIEVVEIGGCTSPLQVDSLGMKICVVKSTRNGAPLGSIAIQTVVGALDSRIVVKIGPVTFGGKERTSKVLDNDKSRSIILDDFLRLRVRWTELQISLCDTQLAAETNKARLEADRMKKELSTYVGVAESPVVQLLFHRFTIDFQRIFKKAKGTTAKEAIRSPERSQLAIIVHNMRILDCVRGSPHPVVFDGFTNQNIFDLCVRFRGPINEDLIKVELVDFHLAWSKTSSDVIAISASEEFIWRVLDVVNRIISATSELAGQQMELNWDSENTEFVVSVVDTDDKIYSGNGNVDYKPPQSDLLLDVKTARVSPINLLVSLKRDPQASRYNTDTGEAPGAKLTHFITTQLKFTIEKAKLRFPGYIARNIKGPPDRLLEPFMLFYISRVKKQFFNLITAVSIQDWKFVTNRDDGDDDFLEGDILRAGGNVIGSSAGLAVMSVGAGVGDGLSKLTGSIGNKVEKSSAMIGAGAVGSRVNVLVSGLGEGVGSTVKGVGSGAGDLVRGTGKGVGQIAGGLTGGVSVIGKGIAEGIQNKDGKKVLVSFADGAAVVGGGIGGGLGTTAKGIGSGVVNVGEGLFSGVKSIGKGIGGVFTGRKDGGPKQEDRQRRGK